jgi:hypothetical protein
MLINIVLVVLLFGAARKKCNPYAAAAILGAIKGVLYFIGSHSIIAAFLAFLVFGGLTAAMVYFLSRVDWKEATEAPYTRFGTMKKSPFKWEYVPLSAIVFLLIFGEMAVGMMLA